MNKKTDKIKPAADKRTLIFLSFLMWVVVGLILLSYVYFWLFSPQIRNPFIFMGAGFGLALIIHHFGFLRLVDKNLGRLLPMKEKKCVFSFMTWKSYLIVIIMITVGILLRHSSIPKSYLSVLYIGIGLSLILSSIRYLRYFLFQKT